MNPLVVLLVLLQALVPAPKPVPRLQSVPFPGGEVSFQLDGKELARYHYGPGLERPFVFPVIGPSGRMLTRMGHPHDPNTHSHHNSVWISHGDVNGVDFWTDRKPGDIVHRRFLELGDSDAAAWAAAENAWLAPDGAVLLREVRRTAVEVLSGGDWMLVLDIELSPVSGDVTFGKTPFGMLGVRMARSIGVGDGGGVIRNSEGGVNEEQILGKRARWVDYSGAVSNSAIEGIALLDHPGNPNHPSYFHVRNDGWMGASFSYDALRTLRPGEKLKLRYALFVHSGYPSKAVLDERWDAFSKSSAAEFKYRTN